jgi:TatD DNase family protein
MNTLFPIIETHCHLDSLKVLTPALAIEQAKLQGIEKIVTIGVEPENLPTILELCSQHEILFGTLGIHPHSAKDFTDEVVQFIQQGISQGIGAQKIVAIGEIGLDYFYDFSPRNLQIAAFERQLQLAVDSQLPVVIHSRDADEDMMRILKKFSPAMTKKGVIHSFSSSLELAQMAIDEGFYLGFNGMITFKNADNVRKALEITPIDKILFETDSPYLAPVPHRGKENAPAHLPFIAKKAFEIKQIAGKLMGMSQEVFYQTVYANSLRLFFKIF